ncbi:MAG: rRNA maturation RNase YbeY [Flavobacteriaceae bacterium]|nr:rRNA maturation RNase YbeY [Flavobacteriaceae bacterium]
MAIKFHNLPKQINEKQLINNIKKFVTKHGGSIEKLEIHFVPRERMDQVHKMFLNDDETDTMTFNYGTKEKIITESFISPWFVKRSAKERNTPYIQELLRVIGHSLSHGLGHNDDTPHEKKIMTRLEDEFIELFQIPKI